MSAGRPTHATRRGVHMGERWCFAGRKTGNRGRIGDLQNANGRGTLAKRNTAVRKVKQERIKEDQGVGRMQESSRWEGELLVGGKTSRNDLS